MKANFFRETDIKKAYRNGFTAGVRRSLDDILNVVTLVLQDKHGWNNQQLDELEKQVNYQFDSICRGYLDFNDVEQAREEIQ